MKKITILFLLTLTLISCSMAPKKANSKIIKKMPKQFSKISQKDIVSDKWWESFGDQTLNKTVEQAIKNNLDLKMAIKNVKIFEAQFKIARSGMMPKASLNAGFTEARAAIPSVKMVPNPANPTQPKMQQVYNAQWNEKYTLNLGFMYELDLWGKIRNMKNAALENMFASKANLQSLYLMITARTTIAYFQIKKDKELLQIAQNQLLLAKKALLIAKKRYELGIDSRLNIESKRIAVTNAKRAIENLEKQLKIDKNLIAVLLGRYPEQKIFKTTGSEIQIPNISAGIPSNLLKNRGDILSAKHKMEAARQMAGYAKANLFPSISINAGLGYAVQSISDLFTGKFLAATLGSSLSQTLFAGGAKTATLKQKQIQYKIAILNYEKTVLKAFQEVEDAIISLETAKKMKKRALENLKNTQSLMDQIKLRYSMGIIPFTKFLDVKQNFLKAQQGLVQAKTGEILATINLCRAIGKYPKK